MNLILFDDPAIRTDLLPFTFTRPTAKIRVGILTIDEKWERHLNIQASFKTESYLQHKFKMISTGDNLLINGAVCPDEKLISAIKSLEPGKFLIKDTTLLASRRPVGDMSNVNTVAYNHPVTIIDKPWKIFRENAAQIKADFKLITSGRRSAGIADKHTIVYGEENLFVEEGVTIKAAIINAESGPVYLGKNSIIQEGAIIRGSFALCEGGHINVGAKMRGDITVGPYSRVGGEVSTSVIFGYSNKAHDGFMGCTVMGEWCNLGADTNTSNLKNNYDTVKLWSHAKEVFVDTGLQFCGLMMGDHSKCGINTMFNTGTVIDVSANVFGEGFPRNYIPSFSWGGAAGLTTYQLEKALLTAERVMARRNIPLDDIEKDILKKVFELTAPSRTW
jgi:UDP-N-acetylglucosamine diphosphorylase/glucosamine-1-phosphate N-acetyltransferase